MTYEFVHILSHMRSGSTLLTHLLASHPEIIGYGETHIRYKGPKDFDALVADVLQTLGRSPLPGRERYVLDKLLHDHLLEPDNVRLLIEARVRVVFLLREPRGSLASMLKHLEMTEQNAALYYITRLVTLERYAQALAPHAACAALTYDQLLYRTDESLELLKSHLGLRHAPAENYRMLPTTGQRRAGDFSPNIFAGSIVRGGEEPGGPQPSAEVLEGAGRVYEHCRTALEQTCRHVKS